MGVGGWGWGGGVCVCACVWCSNGMQWILGRVTILQKGFRWICTLAQVLFCRCAVYFLSIFSFECFCLTASVKLLCLYCFFCMYYFNVVHVFYVMKNSPSCEIFYCIIILKPICLIL